MVGPPRLQRLTGLALDSEGLENSSFAEHQMVTLHSGRWIAFFGEFTDHRVWNGILPSLILTQKRIEHRFKLDNLESDVVIGE
jgi:hypothetical protein